MHTVPWVLAARIIISEYAYKYPAVPRYIPLLKAKAAISRGYFIHQEYSAIIYFMDRKV
jgi:hypothetical protein